MNVTERYIEALDTEELFENSAHRTRFKELLDCFSRFPFFTKGLCKCMYLSAWDDEHFAVMLQTLNDMSLGQEENTDDMRIQGDTLAEEQTDGGYYIYQLSSAFLDGQEFHLDENAVMDDSFRYIIAQALKAAEAIDRV